MEEVSNLSSDRLLDDDDAMVLSGLPDDGTCDVPKHVVDLLTSDVYTFWCMRSWFYNLM